MSIKLFLIATILTIFANSALACSVCFFDASDDPQIKGLQWAFLVLLALLAFIFTLFIKFFINVGRRSKLLQ